MPALHHTVKVEVPHIANSRVAFATMNIDLIKHRHSIEEKHQVRRGSRVVFTLEELNATHAVYRWRIEKAEEK